MALTSYIFLFSFLPVVLICSYFCHSNKLRNILLTLLSYLFCGWANPIFILLLFLITLVNYFSGLLIEKTCRKKAAVIAGVFINLTFLGFFKYFNFGVDSYNQLIKLFGLTDYQFTIFLRMALPLGISFYTFQSISYIVDIYRGTIAATHSFIDFACYISMFPKLVAGPIVRFSEISSQLKERCLSLDHFTRGFSFFALGFVKKVIISNPCGRIADTCFNSVDISAVDAWYGAFAYSFQIYFDFSAYSDMAIGLALMLGFIFPKNFDSPYLSKSITEFWRRWHISLSSWLKDYLYIPFGGNRKGDKRTYVNLAMVMLLGGLWHGASWNFVIWGGIHGFMLALERMQGKSNVYSKLPGPVRIIITFIIVTFAWVFFRAETLQASIGYIETMLGLTQVSDAGLLVVGIIHQPYYFATMLIAIIVIWKTPQVWDFTRKLSWTKAIYISVAFIVALIIALTHSYNPFIYSAF